jgi:hypothetical protein
MHLVYKALEKYAIPNSVPPELLPPGKRKDPPPPTISAPIIPIAPITKPVEPAKVRTRRQAASYHCYRCYGWPLMIPQLWAGRRAASVKQNFFIQ